MMTTKSGGKWPLSRVLGEPARPREGAGIS